MSAPAQIDWQNDPGFQQLPLMEKHKALLAIDPTYKALPPQEQVKALKSVHYGSDPQGTPENYGFTAENMFSKAWSGVKELAGGVGEMASDVGNKSWSDLEKKYVRDPAFREQELARNAKSPMESIGHSVAESLPLVGPWAASLGEQAGTGDIGGAAARGGSQVLAGEAAARIPGKVGALAERAKGGVTPAIQKTLGVGSDFTEQAIKDYQGKVADVAETNRGRQETYQGKVEAAKQANERAKQTAVQKQQLQTEAMGHAKELGDHLPQLKEQEKAFAKSLYPEVEGTAPAAEMQGKIQDAIDSNIRGTDKPPAVLSRMVKDLEPENPLAQASVFRGAGMEGRATRGGTNLSDLPPSVRERMMNQLGPEERAGYESPEAATGKDLSFEQLHGYYSELGEELSKDLAGDERASVTQARSVILDKMRKMAESQNKLTQFTEAQKNWGKYENTFNKTWSDKRGVASPIAKALNAKDPVTGEMLPERLAKILGKDENYKLAQQMLSRYQGGKPELLQLMKEKMDQAGGMPKSIKETPMPQEPSLKAAPETPDIQGMKAEALKKKSEMLGGFSGRGMFIDAASLTHFLTTGNPVALSIPIGRRLLAKAIRAGTEGGSLVSISPEEAAMLKSVGQGGEPKNIPPSQVHPTKAAAAAALKGGGVNARPASLPGWESETEAARRGAPGINPKLKSLRRHQEKNK